MTEQMGGGWDIAPGQMLPPPLMHPIVSLSPAADPKISLKKSLIQLEVGGSQEGEDRREVSCFDWVET